MRKKLLYTLGVISILFSFVFFFGTRNSVEAVSSSVVISARTASATTTTTAITTSTASSSLVAKIDGADSVNIEMCNTPVNPTAVLHFAVFYSMDDGVGNSNPTWFQETDSSTSLQVSSHPRLSHSQALATSSHPFTCTTIPISNVGARQIKVDYTVKGAGTSIWMAIASKIQR